VIKLDGDSVFLAGPVTLATVPGLVDAVKDQLQQGARIVDFHDVTEVDSSAVALALEWIRTAGEGKTGPRLANMPAAMQNLAKLYGVSELLQSASG
jgi:phospholipid transport system transporter-binding protein